MYDNGKMNWGTIHWLNIYFFLRFTLTFDDATAAQHFTFISYQDPRRMRFYSLSYMFERCVDEDVRCCVILSMRDVCSVDRLVMSRIYNRSVGIVVFL